MKYYVCLIILICSFAVSSGAQARLYADNSDYAAAFAALDQGRNDRAEIVAAQGSDAVLNDVLRVNLMAQPGNTYSFEELSNFVYAHPEWPGLNGVLMIAEQKIPANASAQQVTNWFAAHPALTVAGLYRYIDALQSLSQKPKAIEIVRNAYIERDFTQTELVTFQSRYTHFLRTVDAQKRMSRLVWQGKIAAAKAMYPLVGKDWKALAEARFALAGQNKKAMKLLAVVPASLRNNPELQYEKVRWYRRNNKNNEALAIVRHMREDEAHAEAWWDERAVLSRRSMEKHNYAEAYEIVRAHGLKNGFSYLQAEFTAGWLALRFLKKPQLAVQHFAHMLANASSPVSKARATYWLARAQEVLGKTAEARKNYEIAATFNFTFYGQLALTRIDQNPVLRALPEPAIPPQIRTAYTNKTVVAAIGKLMRIGQSERARIFFKAALKAAEKRADFVLLMERVYELGRPDWAITVAKAGNQNNMVVAGQAFPLLELNVPTPPEAAFTHALIRQESLFDPEARSPAGARGLMQLLPSTARETAAKLDIPYAEGRLSDPEYNVRLGTAFVQRQLDSFDGSYILSLAGYNAGPRRVREWMANWGDPRTARIDAIDWIELMPIYETRNYVQRIIENLQVYRARLSGGAAKLQILQDLKR